MVRPFSGGVGTKVPQENAKQAIMRTLEVTLAVVYWDYRLSPLLL